MAAKKTRQSAGGRSANTRPARSASKKAATKKTATKKAATKKTATKKAATKKAATKKAAAKKRPAVKPAKKKQTRGAAKKAQATRATKTSAKRTPARKVAKRGAKRTSQRARATPRKAASTSQKDLLAVAFPWTAAPEPSSPSPEHREDDAPPVTRPKRALRSALRELVPTTIRHEGEENEYLRVYKLKWLSRFDFRDDTHVDSLLFLAYMTLALGRLREAEWTSDQLIRHVDLSRASPPARASVTSALRLSAYLKARRGLDVSPLLARARWLSQKIAQRDREWLTHEAAREIDDALAREKIAYLGYPLAGILAWLNEPGARTTAELLLERALKALRALMK